MTFQARQGDVFVRQVPARDLAGVTIGDRTDVVLASGEVSGHAHRVVPAVKGRDDYPTAQCVEGPDGRRYLLVEQACMLTHEEHGPIAIQPGCYRVTVQREYTPEGLRNVLD